MVLGAAARVAIVGCRRLVCSSSHASPLLVSSSQCRQMSMDAQSVSEKLRNSGLLRTQGLIGGKWIDSYDKTTIKVNNPATGEIVADVACMGVKETNDAIASSYEAFPSWSRRTAGERSKVLRRWFDLLVAHKEELGQLITLEQGKPLKEAIGEVAYGASFIEYYAEEAKRVYGDIIPPNASDRRLLVLKQPIGVVGAITPWNFPLAMITRKVGPALASGCTVVVKPSELTPLTALAAAELALQAGVPPGALNVVMGNAPEIGDALLTSPQVRKITFTGSTAVSLELGGNAPSIIFDDADLDVAVKGTLAAKFRNSGQTCVCANRVLVQDGIYDKFAEAFSEAVQKLEVGDGFKEGQPSKTEKSCISPIHTNKRYFLCSVVVFFLKGAKVLLGGKKHSLGMTFYEPTVIRDEEIFGPVAPLIRFKTEEDAIRIANDTIAGLAAYIFTNSVQRSWRVSEALEYGLVGVNEGIISTEVAPFGGVKQSGLGREGSKYGMDEYHEGAKILLGGKKHSLGMTFYEPTVIRDVTSNMIMSKEEIFGPVAPLIRFKTEEDAIRIANDTIAGLAAYIFTNSVQRSWRVSEALEYGLVGVNEGIISTEVAPFGGVKQSGLGREGSKYGMDEYHEIKYICMGDMNRQ
ncbi:hypothetical protein Bca52824_084974 [Brassica carinata]|uniref:Succinate-semialdehyde dehydrogenase, mitochondrial n=1 Tax=Brassica carinata TaxID=52824 RepID=A0A8X7PQI1_BRACI|nr:hypothetical protein Bca52824_084974 [Brassica carinata]